MITKGFFPRQRFSTVSQQIVVTADTAWPLADDTELYNRLVGAIQRELWQTEQETPSPLPIVSFDVEGWRSAASEYTVHGLRPVGRGAWGHNFDTLRTNQRIEVKLTLSYGEPDAPTE